MVEKHLERCPFCGGRADFYDVKTNGAIKMMKIQCESCKAQMGLFVDSEKGEKEAIEMWNHRISSMPTIDYGVSNYYWQILHDINPKLADDASETAKKQVTQERGLADIRERPSISNYDLPVKTVATYEAMLREREVTISDLKASNTRIKNLYQKEKNCLGKKKVALNSTDFTKIKNIKKSADALFEILDSRFKEEYGDDYADHISRVDNLK